MNTIEENIRFALRKKGMTIRQLAEKSGIPEPSLHRILKSGDYKFSHLTKIYEAMEVDFYDLVGIPPSRNHNFSPIMELPDDQKVVLEKKRYDSIIVETRRLRKHLVDVQSKYILLLEEIKGERPLITQREPYPEDDVTL